MRWVRAFAAAAVVVVVVVCVALPAAAQPERLIDMEVMVTHISNRTGGIDPSGRKLDGKLRDQFRYESLRVLQHRNLSLRIDQVGKMKLPNGRSLRIRPLQLSDRGLLTAVSVEGTLQTDLRIRNGHLVVIGAERFEDGKLIISLEPRF